MNSSDNRHHVLNLINSIDVHSQLIELCTQENMGEKIIQEKIKQYLEEIKNSTKILVEFIREKEIT